LLDSGAAVTILGNNSHSHLVDCTLHQDDRISMTAAGGQALNSIGYMNLPVTFEGQFHVIRAYVVPEVETSIILGIDFWRAFQICPKYLGSITLSKRPLAELKLNNAETFINSYVNLIEPQKAIADNVIAQFRSISSEEKGLGRTSLITHRIDTGDAQPIRQRYYRMSPEKQRILTEQVDEMLSLDVIEPVVISSADSK
jgi:hypothetical protein